MPIDHGYLDIDGGPIYKETLFGRWPVEPFNTLTTLFFLLVVVYWWLRIRPHYKEHVLLTISLPLIGIGFVGGFLYHSLRNNSLWLYLDWGPILITALVVSAYFWRTQILSWWMSGLLSVTPLFLMLWIRKMWGDSTSFPSLSYFLLILSVVLPLVLYVYKKPQHLKYIGFTLLSITLALSSRLLDRNELMEWLPMGSHFLWHSFGALTCHFFINYVFLAKPQLKKP